MIKPVKRIRRVLHQIHPIPYRIKITSPDKSTMHKKLFIEILDQLKKIEDRRDFMQDEIGIDVTVYEDSFFRVIENLMKLAFNKEQLGMIRLYLYELYPDKEWDGTITVKQGEKDKVVNFKTPIDVWNVIINVK